MWLVRMFVHITVWKLYFGWSNPHFLSQFSVEPAHSSSSVPHCPFSLHSLSFCGLLPLPSPLSPSPSAGPLLTLPVSRGRMRPAYPSPAPHSRKFLFPFIFFWTIQDPRGTIQTFYHPICCYFHCQFQHYLICILGTKLWLWNGKISFWHRITVLFSRLWRKLVKMIFFLFERAQLLLFAYGVKSN